MRKCLLLIPILILAFASVGWADVFTGSISGPGNGLYGTDGWSDAILDWTVTTPAQSASGYWEYTYTF